MIQEEISSFSAKTHFSHILSEVEKGKRVIITKRGKRIATMSPYQADHLEENVIKEAIESIKNLRKGITLGPNLSIKTMREQGRR